MSSAAPPSPAPLPHAFRYLFFAVLVNRLGSFVVPFLALYLTDARGFGATTVGAVAAAYGVGAILSQLLGGVLADRIGRRAAIVTGFVASAVAITTLGFARDLHFLGFATFLVGLSDGLARPATQAALADIVPAADRARAFTYIYWAANLGFATASVLAGFLAETRFELLFLADAATSLGAAVIIFLRLPETRPAATARTASRTPLRDILTPFASTPFRVLFGITLLAAIVFFQFGSTMPIDLRSHGIDARTYGALAGLNGLLVVLLQPFSIRLAARVRPYDALALGAILSGIGFGLFGYTTSVWGYAVAIFILTLGEIATAPAGGVVVSEIAPPHLRGSYQGAFGMVFSLAGAIGPLLGSRALDSLGSTAFWSLTFLLSAVAAGLYLSRGRRNSTAHVTASEPG